VTFVDTSGLYAALDADSSDQPAATEIWQRLLREREPLLTSSYVLLETFALVQRRLGMTAVQVLHEDVRPLLEIAWVDESLHSTAVTALLAANRRGLSLVDCTSFAVMRSRGIRRAFAFDNDFALQGFELATA
jgi:predicted nucleic acid-binding protein